MCGYSSGPGFDAHGHPTTIWLTLSIPLQGKFACLRLDIARRQRAEEAWSKWDKSPRIFGRAQVLPDLLKMLSGAGLRSNTETSPQRVSSLRCGYAT